MDDSTERKKSANGKRRYVPHLAKFFFRPDFDWSVEEAQSLYENSASNHDFKLYIVRYVDCVKG